MIREKIKHVNNRITKSYASLRFTLLSNLLFALGVAIALFLISNILFDRYIETRYMSNEKRSERVDEYVSELQSYVSEHALNCDDIEEISDWAHEKKYLYILVYKDDKLLFETGQYEEEKVENKENADDGTGNSVVDGENQQTGSLPDDAPDGDSEGDIVTGNQDDKANDGDTAKENVKYQTTGITVKTPTREELIAKAEDRGSHAIEAEDGTLLVSMADYTEYLYYDIFNIVSILLAFVGFIIVMWIYFFEITNKISRLGREVTAVADGDVNHRITTDGDDEIARLCADVEYMRISMLENIEKERAALEANKELITAMSHDIRTPLTVLLGYLDIMKSNTTDSDMQQYIEVSERTAMRLKKMSDDMFSYFLVYGGGIELEIEECDARTLVDQMLSGHVFLLREQGYDITFNFEDEDNKFLENVTVVTDPPQLMRIVENLFSNIIKYADKEKPVIVQIGSDTDEMSIKVSNYVAKVIDEAQKNGIGLRSCMKLASAMDIRFSSVEEDGMFISEMYIPIIPELEIPDDENIEESEGFTKWLKSIFEKSKSFLKELWKKMIKISKKK